MCRSIKCLVHFEPPAGDDEIRAAALQFVRKLSGTTHPSRVNEVAFDRAVEEMAAAAGQLLNALTISASPRNREEEARKARQREQRRYIRNTPARRLIRRRGRQYRRPPD